MLPLYQFCYLLHLQPYLINAHLRVYCWHQHFMILSSSLNFILSHQHSSTFTRLTLIFINIIFYISLSFFLIFYLPPIQSLNFLLIIFTIFVYLPFDETGIITVRSVLLRTWWRILTSINRFLCNLNNGCVVLPFEIS